MSLSIGSLFSGFGLLELGLEWAGLGPTLWQVESDPYARRVLAKHWGLAARFDDVRTVDATVLRPVAILCGGFPCQDVSAAGKGAGLAGARSGLWREFARLARELAPRFVVVENVASGARRWLPFVRRDLHVLGYRTRAYALSAADVGAPHLRKRIFVVAYADRQGQLQPPWQGQERNGARDGGCDATDADGARLEERQFEQARPQRAASERGRVPASAWASSAGVRRMAHGVPHRMERLRGLGNAVVPQCAEVIGRIVADLVAGNRFDA